MLKSTSSHSQLSEEISDTSSDGTGSLLAQPLPFGVTLSRLPGQYFKILTRPGPTVFVEEQGKAAWNGICIQLLIISVLSACIEIFNLSKLNPLSLGMQAAGILGFSVLFAGMVFALCCFEHWLAKAFGGRGTFLAYSYCFLLLQTPFSFCACLISGVMALISQVFLLFPLVLVSFALGCYQIVLQVFMTMAVHKMSGGKATLAVLLVQLILIVCAFVFACLLVWIVASSVA